MVVQKSGQPVHQLVTIFIVGDEHVRIVRQINLLNSFVQIQFVQDVEQVGSVQKSAQIEFVHDIML